jgi:ankyrin repeat protein
VSFAGCAKTASRLLEQRANIFARNILGLSALHIAVAKGAGPVVGLLLRISTGRFLSLKDHSGLTALHYAAKFGEEDILRLLISWIGIGSDKIFVDEGDYEAKTALHHAALSGKLNAKIAQHLLENEAYINFPDMFGHTPLVCAATCGNEQVVKVLLDNQNSGDLVNCGGLTALSEAAGNGHLEFVQLLLSSKPWPDVVKRRWPTVLNESPGGEILLRAIQGGHTAVVNLLVQAGAEVPIADYQTSRISLYWPAISGNIPMAETLLTLGINVSNGGGPELLYEAASHGHVDMVSWLLRSGARLEDKGQYHGTALRGSTANGYSAVVRFLLEQGANIEAQDIAGWTPLHCAAKMVMKRLYGFCCRRELMSPHRLTIVLCSLSSCYGRPCRSCTSLDRTRSRNRRRE